MRNNKFAISKYRIMRYQKLDTEILFECSAAVYTCSLLLKYEIREIRNSRLRQTLTVRCIVKEASCKRTNRSFTVEGKEATASAFMMNKIKYFEFATVV